MAITLTRPEPWPGSGFAGGVSLCGCSRVGTMGIEGTICELTLCDRHQADALRRGYTLQDIDVALAYQSAVYLEEHPEFRPPAEAA